MISMNGSYNEYINNVLNIISHNLSPNLGAIEGQTIYLVLLLLKLYKYSFN